MGSYDGVSLAEGSTILHTTRSGSASKASSETRHPAFAHPVVGQRHGDDLGAHSNTRATASNPSATNYVHHKEVHTNEGGQVISTSLSGVVSSAHPPPSPRGGRKARRERTTLIFAEDFSLEEATGCKHA